MAKGLGYCSGVPKGWLRREYVRFSVGSASQSSSEPVLAVFRMCCRVEGVV